jgi:hypothetical protein
LSLGLKLDFYTYLFGSSLREAALNTEEGEFVVRFFSFILLSGLKESMFQPHDPAIPLLENSRRNVSQVTIKAPAHPCLLQHYSQYLCKQPRCPSTDEWIKKMCYLYTMEFYSATKKNEILSFASKWMELENIMLSEVSQVQKAKSHAFLVCGI